MSRYADPQLIVVTGICASGKSTVGRALAARFPRGALVEGDVFGRMVVSGRAELTAEFGAAATAQFELRLRLLARVAAAYAGAGFTTIAEDNLHGRYLEWFLCQLDLRPVHVVVLAPGPETCAWRDAAREKHAYGAGRWDAVQLDAAFREDTAKLGLWLDTSDRTVGETVDEIVRRLNEGEVR